MKPIGKKEFDVVMEQMPGWQLKQSNSYNKTVQGLVQLHELIILGNGDSDEADRIRDSLDEPFKNLSEVEGNQTRNFSESLFTLSTLCNGNFFAIESIEDPNVTKIIQINHGVITIIQE